MGQVERDTRNRVGSDHERPRAGLKALVRSVEIGLAISELELGSSARVFRHDNRVEVVSRIARSRHEEHEVKWAEVSHNHTSI